MELKLRSTSNKKRMKTPGEQKSGKSEQACYTFKLFIVKEGAHSERARKNLENLCSKWLPGRYYIEVIDVLESFNTALKYNILLTPAVVVTEPKPRITIHGDLSDTRKLLDVLNIAESDQND